MTRETGLTRVAVLIGCVIMAVTVAMGSPAPVGWLLGSRNATLDGQSALPHTALLSGDSLQVRDGLAMVTLDHGSRVVVGRNTEAAFSREAGSVTVSLSRGTMSLFNPEASSSLRVKVGDVTVLPSEGSRTLGEIAMVNGLVLVTAKNGTLQVESAGNTQQVGTGKTITIAARPASAPTPMPQGNRHVKHVLSISPAALLFLGIGAEVGGTAWAIAAASSSGKPASPVTP